MKKPVISPVNYWLRKGLAIIAFPLSITHRLISSFQVSRYQMPGQVVDAGDRKLHAIIMGEEQGLPTVVLEAGLGGCSLDWSLVQPEIAQYTKVVSYDRAGYGWSKKCTEQATSQDAVHRLREVLQKLGVKPPYILVAHSFGGLHMRLFASRYPQEVAGLILVDAAHEDRYMPDNKNENRQRQLDSVFKLHKLAFYLAPLGITRIKKMFIGSKRMPEPYGGMIRALGYRSNAYDAFFNELLNSAESSRQVKQLDPLPANMPIIVLSAGKQDEDWKSDQQKFVHLTLQTKQVMVEDSWHSIQIYRPDVVIESIKQLLIKEV
jgi:pimeloyl-ACP methyl ester carboxylesterase